MPITDTSAIDQSMYDDQEAQPDTEGRSLVPSPVPSRQFQEEAFDYVTRWCRASCEFIDKKIERWKLLEDLYHNRRELNSWGARTDLVASQNRAGLKRHTASGKRAVASGYYSVTVVHRGFLGGPGLPGHGQRR